MVYKADDNDLPQGMFKDRMSEARARVRSICDELGLQPTSQELRLCAIVLVVMAEDDATGGRR